jgi:hypothetical protein
MELRAVRLAVRFGGASVEGGEEAAKSGSRDDLAVQK